MIGERRWSAVLKDLEPGTEYLMQFVLGVQGAQKIESPIVRFTTKQRGERRRRDLAKYITV